MQLQALEVEVFEFPKGTSLDFSGKCRSTEFENILNKVMIMLNDVLLSNSLVDKNQMQIINKLREEIDCFRIDGDVENITRIRKELSNNNIV